LAAGLRPDMLGAIVLPQIPLAAIKGPTFKGKGEEGEGKGEKGKEGEGKGREWKGASAPQMTFLHDVPEYA